MENFTTDSDSICALILAGGAGRRVGGRDKGLLQWRGRPLIEQVHQVVAPQVSRCLISCNRNREQYAKIAPLAPADSRRDYQGPLAGIEAALGSIDQEFILLAPCDTPRLPADLAEVLLLALRQSTQSQAVYARAGDREHYLCALLRRSGQEGLKAYLDSGQRAVRHWYKQVGAFAVDFPSGESDFLNINEAAELD